MKKKNKGSVTCTSTLVRKDSADYDSKQIKQKKKKIMIIITIAD